MSNKYKCPEGLSQRSQKLWAFATRSQVRSAGRRELLRQSLMILDRADGAAAIIAAEGMTTTDKRGTVRAHPMIAVELQHRRQFIALWESSLQLAYDADVDDEDLRDIHIESTAAGHFAQRHTNRGISPQK